MSSLYELYSKRTKYKTLRENVSNAINVLSRNTFADNLSTVDYTLSNNYQVNESTVKGSIIGNAKDNVATDLNNLNLCLSSINSKIYSLNKEIAEKEAEEAVA